MTKAEKQFAHFCSFLHITIVLLNFTELKLVWRMAGDLLQLRAKVECCTFSDFRSTQTMYHLIHQIVEVVQQQYVPGSDPTAFYDILWRFHTAEQHLNIFKPAALD